MCGPHDKNLVYFYDFFVRLYRLIRPDSRAGRSHSDMS